ncbi:hypothetical protein B0H10DRAFT_2242801 [Mycena sp. CBHHK59/15]|nr:hypothetical protein B0H10DRAFT_2242801 [Mycena sp. CBHHK59/15]
MLAISNAADDPADDPDADGHDGDDERSKRDLLIACFLVIALGPHFPSLPTSHFPFTGPTDDAHVPRCSPLVRRFLDRSPLGLAHFPLPIHWLHGRRPCSLNGLSSCTPRAPAMALTLSVGEDDFAGDGAFLVDGVGLRGIQEVRAKRAGRAASVSSSASGKSLHPYHAHLGRAPFMEDADTAGVEVGVWNCECETWWWGVNLVPGVQNKVLPYRSPRKTLRAQASVASGPARASASTTTMRQRYSPAILQSSEARASNTDSGVSPELGTQHRMFKFRPHLPGAVPP